ncbi:MAG: AAA family ATPase [Minisyncoccota bacterium]
MSTLPEPIPLKGVHKRSGPKVLLVGDSGCGKTYAFRSFIPLGVTPFILATEPNIEDVLGDIPCPKLHWHYIAPANPDWDTLIDSAKKINTLPFKALAEMGDINKQKYDQFIQLLRALHNFKCDRCGQEFGDVSSWDSDRAIGLDSLTGLNQMAMNLIVGSKPVKSMADWQIAMDNLERIINKLTTDTKAWFILTAHLERETDEVTGGIQLMASTLGKKLAPKLPRFFSDVVHVIRQGTAFKWSTATLNVALKTRNLPISDTLAADFKLLHATWKAKESI